MLYESRCIACHSVESNRVGPRHRGVFGRRAGALADFAYSPALAGSEIVWDAAALDRWLENPEALIPGQRMNIRVAAPVDRADIIAYLKEES
jgi:cytochrome c